MAKIDAKFVINEMSNVITTRMMGVAKSFMKAGDKGAVIIKVNMEQMVRAKFVVDKIAKTRYGHGEITMSPVSGGSEENKKFWQYTPCGSISLSTTNNAALEQFEVGKEYYVDFTESPIADG